MSNVADRVQLHMTRQLTTGAWFEATIAAFGLHVPNTLRYAMLQLRLHVQISPTRMFPDKPIALTMPSMSGHALAGAEPLPPD